MNEEKAKKIDTDIETARMEGADIEALIKLMRDRGYNQRRSADEPRTITGLSYEEAHAAVLESEAWKDQNERNLQIEDELAQAFIELSQYESSGIKVVFEVEVQATDPRLILRRRRDRCGTVPSLRHLPE